MRMKPFFTCSAITLACIACITTFSASSSVAQQPPLSSYTVVRTTGAITIDGKLDEADWKKAAECTLVETNTGKPVPLKSTVKMLWDDTNIYFGFFCEDPDAWATYTKNEDPLWEEEVVELFIDPDGNIANYYEVEYNPVNTVVDLYVINGGEKMKGAIQGWFQWNFKNMKNATFVKGDGLKPDTRDEFWTVEIAIPFKDLWEAPRIPPENGDSWRLNAYRIERGKKDDKKDDWYAAFSPTTRPSFHTPWRFGTITFRK